LITSFGRNVAPEWPEAELISTAVIAQAAVFGEARRRLCAVIVPRLHAVTDAAIDAAARRQSSLPDYAQVAHWIRLGLSACNGLHAELPRTARCRLKHYCTSRISMKLTPMSAPFFEVLQQHTAAERDDLFSIPIIRDALAGRVTREQYIAFLTEAYHHVKHTVPLLMACGSRLPESAGWLRAAVVEYIGEESGHEEWILGDIAAAGGDANAVRNGAADLRPS
jgi:hypothetical protein